MKHSYQPWQWAVIVASFALLILIGWLDYVTGYELGFFIFYSIPVGILAWYVGRGPGIAISFASALTWLIADLYAGQKYSSTLMIWWNTGVRSVCFIINAVTLAKIKQTLDQRKDLVAALAEAKQRVVRLEGLLPICPVCRKPRDDDDYHQQWEIFLRDPRNTNPPRSVCPSCRDKMQPDATPVGAGASDLPSSEPPPVAQETSQAAG